MNDTPEGIISCDKCEKFHEDQNLELPCANYVEGDEFLFYDGKQNPLCHVINEPKVEGDDRTALNLWFLIKDERIHTEGPNTLKSFDILVICQLYEQPLEIFEKIKYIERLYFNHIVKRHSDHIEEIRSKSKHNKPK